MSETRDGNDEGGDGQSEGHRTARLVMVLGILAGLAYAITVPLVRPSQVALASDVYYHAARELLAGGDFYAVSPPDRSASYIYPPVVIAAFVPHALLGSETAAFALQTLVNLAVGLGTAAILWRALCRRGVELTRLDGVLLVGFVLLSAHGVPTVLMGQTTLPLAFALAVGFDALERDRPGLAGTVFAAAALVKLFPAIVGAWLLRLGAWRGVGAALATGLGGLLAGLLAFGPDPTVVYFTEVLPGRFQGEAFAGTPDPARELSTARRQLAALLPVDPSWLSPLAFLLLAPPVAACYRRIDTDERRLTAILATLVGVLLFLPLEPLYFSLLVYPLVGLLYTLEPGPPRKLLVAGTLLTYVLIGYPTVEIFVGMAPGAVEAAALAAAETAFTFILPPTVGMWLLLAACLLVHYGREVGPSLDVTPVE